jgi:hypothetical protein
VTAIKSWGSVSVWHLSYIICVTHCQRVSMFENDLRPQLKRNRFHPTTTSQYMSELTSKIQKKVRFIHVIGFV